MARYFTHYWANEIWEREKYHQEIGRESAPDRAYSPNLPFCSHQFGFCECDQPVTLMSVFL